MDEKQARAQGSSFSGAAPPRRGNLFRAFLIMVGAGVVAGCVLFGLLTLKQAAFAHTTDPKPEQQPPPVEKVEKTVIVQEEVMPYPDSKAEAAKLYGGNPLSWFRWQGGWVYYNTDTAIRIPTTHTVTVYTEHAAFFWEKAATRKE